MRNVTRLVLAGWLFALAPALVAAAHQQAPDVEREVFYLLNREREAEGIAPVEWDDRLAEAARGHAEVMAAHHAIAHDFRGEPDLKRRVIAGGLRFDRLAENVALAATPAEIHDSLMQSPPHRANILNPGYNAAGVGAIRVGDELFVVEDFAHRLVTYTSDQAEDAVAAAVRKARGSGDLTRLSEPVLREQACAMAEHDSLTTPEVTAKLPRARFILRFTAPDPDRLPASLVAEAANPARSQFAVGGCFARSATYPEGTYWFVVAFVEKSAPPPPPPKGSPPGL